MSEHHPGFMGKQIVVRGTDTRLGEAGWCPDCDQHVPAGPDACIGRRDGVIEACCGHGTPSRAYVTYQYPGMPGPVALYGEAARGWLGLPQWPRSRVS